MAELFCMFVPHCATDYHASTMCYLACQVAITLQLLSYTYRLWYKYVKWNQ